jgi:hypothetical protein
VDRHFFTLSKVFAAPEMRELPLVLPDQHQNVTAPLVLLAVVL